MRVIGGRAAVVEIGPGGGRACAAAVRKDEHQLELTPTGELNRVLRGWAGYFGYGTRYLAYRAVDRYVDARVTQDERA